MTTYTSPYSVEDCDGMIQEYWEQWKRTQKPGVYEFVDYWLEERWRIMEDAVESSQG